MGRPDHNPVFPGQRFGKLIIMGTLAGPGLTRLRCRCDCGEETTVLAGNIKKGNTRSCGCLSRALVSERSTKHGAAKNYELPREYIAWLSMKTRCTNPKSFRYSYYGGRGIRVCARWLNSYHDFLADVGPKPLPKYSLDRIDNNGNYEPGNVRWASQSTQANNRRKRKPNGVAAVAAAPP